MSNERHFTTRRGFVGAMGFGALGLYATWAAYGASPLPFSSAAPPAPSGPGGGHGGGHDGPTVADAPDGARMTPAEFEKRHAEFVRTHRQADGSVRPTGVAANHDAASTGASADHRGPARTDHGDHSTFPARDHAGHDTSMSMSHADHGPSAPMAHDGHAPAAAAKHDGHAPVAVAGTTAASGGHEAHGDHAAPAAPAPAEHADAPIEVYLMAGRFAFEPDDLRLDKGRTYRFHMMATDVAHGASIAFGPASRIVRLRPDTVTTLDLTFREAGRRLVYCTVYCGPGHDAMHASITVA